MRIYSQECAVQQNEGGILPGIYDSTLIEFGFRIKFYARPFILHTIIDLHKS